MIADGRSCTSFDLSVDGRHLLAGELVDAGPGVAEARLVNGLACTQPTAARWRKRTFLLCRYSEIADNKYYVNLARSPGICRALSQRAPHVNFGRGMARYPVTLAVRALRAAAISFEPHLYPWEPRGGTRASAEALGVDEHRVVKTLIFEDDARAPLCVLMHGDHEVSSKQLARHVGVKTVGPCSPEVADRHSGYQVGGTSPFGLRRPMPIYMQRTILDLPVLYINGGARGFLVSMDPHEAARVLSADLVDVAVRRT